MVRSNTDYSRLRDTKAKVSWKTFCTIETGRTNGAHLDFVRKLKDMGQTQVTSSDASDYLLVFCPVVSRVGTDISSALHSIPSGKPVVLVVMHHTFSPDYVVAESWRQVDNSVVRLTVDCLFYEGKFLTCALNDSMWSNVRTFFGAPKTRSILPRSQKFWMKLGSVIVTAIAIYYYRVKIYNTISWLMG